MFFAPLVLAIFDLAKGRETEFIGEFFIALHIVTSVLAVFLIPSAIVGTIYYMGSVYNSFLPLPKSQLPLQLRPGPPHEFLHPELLTPDGRRSARLVGTGFLVIFAMAYGVAGTSAAAEYFAG